MESLLVLWIDWICNISCCSSYHGRNSALFRPVRRTTNPASWWPIERLRMYGEFWIDGWSVGIASSSIASHSLRTGTFTIESVRLNSHCMTAHFIYFRAFPSRTLCFLGCTSLYGLLESFLGRHHRFLAFL